MDASFDHSYRTPSPKPADGKPRSALGPRLKSYLSSNSLLNLGNTTGDEQKRDSGIKWPECSPIFDESTTSGSRDPDKWITALRYRLWHYDELPLDVTYNAQLRQLIDKWARVSKENDQLRGRLHVLELENRDLSLKVKRQPASNHRISRSFSNGHALKDPPFDVPKRQHSNSNPTTSGISSTNRTLAKGASQTSNAIVKNSTLTVASRRLESALSFSSATHSGDIDDLPSNEDEEFISRQNAALKLSTYVSDHTGTDFKLHYQEIAKILRIPTSPPEEVLKPRDLEDSSPASHTHATLVDEVCKTLDGCSEPEKPASVLTRQRRIFSFYPGDDNALETFEKYAHRDGGVDTHLLQPTYLEFPRQTHKLDSSSIEKTIEDIGFSREHSQTSIVTVVKASKSDADEKKVACRIGSETDRPPLGPRIPSRVDKPVANKPQGPVAAAIAATARFGKGGKKNVRQATRDE